MRPINRTQPAKPVMTVDEAVEADRRYFHVHPDENEYIREFVPGEFGKAELPESPGRLPLRNPRLGEAACRRRACRPVPPADDGL